MKQSLKALILVTLCLITHLAVAQDFLGEAIYKSKRKVDVKLDSTKMSPEQRQKTLDMLKKYSQRTYILTFNKQTSEFKEQESLGTPGPSGVSFSISAGDSDVLFKNIKEQLYIQKKDLFGKVFLITDRIPRLDWKLSSETKNIGEYTCFKATKTIAKEKDEDKITYLNDKNESDKEPQITENVTITAWYTPQIPVGNGPNLYGGLPGLILELNDGVEVMVCSKISMNMGKVEIIDPPKKGKKVTQVEYDQISEEKMQEFIKEGRIIRANKDGKQVEIRIGG